LHWVSLGELSRTLELLHEEGVNRAVMAGQVKHNKIFQLHSPGLEAREAPALIAAKKYRFV